MAAVGNNEHDRAGHDLSGNAGRSLGGSNLPAVLAGNEKRVRRDFWIKLKRYAARLPFAEDLVAAYFCALDPATPARARGLLFAALAYFILPADFIPDFLAGIGFSDDFAVLMMAIGLIRAHMLPAHRAAARKALASLDDWP
ncbi:MAG: DUF1232 domain-containing protein [Rhodobiaceae bacterium]|nr:DUF1232 domain-containing protein [Rhodobiaceae bacterium]MCB2009977.1 DUF1232 domain-containing protein [Geminicoccaceae bacterium]